MGADQCRASLQIPKGKDWGRGGSPLVSFEQASHFQEDPRYKVDRKRRVRRSNLMTKMSTDDFYVLYVCSLFKTEIDRIAAIIAAYCTPAADR